MPNLVECLANVDKCCCAVTFVMEVLLDSVYKSVRLFYGSMSWSKAELMIRDRLL